MFGKKEYKRPTGKQVIGKIGEDATCDYLRMKGYSVIDRNYSRKWGELDIVAKKGNVLHFVEVKSVSRETSSSVTCVTDGYRPEDNMHPWKLKRLGRIIQSYLLDKDIDLDWQFDVITVYIGIDKKPWKVSMLEDVVI